MTTINRGKLVRQLGRILDLGPDLVRSPRQIISVIRGMHPGNLVILNRPWIRELEVDVVLDIGANTGQFANVAHYVFPSARIYSFEPLPACLDGIKRRMHGIEQFKVFSSAVGNEDGVITIHQSVSSPSSSALSMTDEHTSAFPWTEGGTDIEVPIHRLDHFLPELDLSGRVLLKIDVQGFGLEVLRGAVATLGRVDIVFIETSFVPLYAGEPSFDEIYTFMKDLGFAFEGVLDQLEHPETRKILQGDAIFRRVL